MSDAINVSKRLGSLDVGNQLTGYSKVEIYAGQDDSGNTIVYTAGDDTGKTLTFKNEFGSQAMANNVLNRIRGFQYQPFNAVGAHADPAAELGDGISMNGIYSGIFQRSTSFSRQMMSDISAPTEDEIEHEFVADTATDRQYSRFVQATKSSLRLMSNQISAEVTARTNADAELSAALTIQATQIAAKVSKTGGTSASFGWTLESDHWSVYSNNSEVFRITASGAEVKGTIKATSGFIGSQDNGFTISGNAIYKNISQYGGTQTEGVYIGTNGIQLGQGFKVNQSGAVTASNLAITGGSISIGNNFSVNSSGNVTANNMSLSGTLTIAGESITAERLYNGVYQAANGYTGWNETRSTVSNNSGNWNNGYKYAYGESYSYANAISNTSQTCPEMLKATVVMAYGDYSALVADDALFVGGWSDDTQAAWQKKLFVTNVTVNEADGSPYNVRDIYGNLRRIYNYPEINVGYTWISYLGNEIR